MRLCLNICNNRAILCVAKPTQTVLRRLPALQSITFCVMVVLFSPRPLAQTFGSSSHTVTVTVATISNIQVSSGTVNLTISGSAAIAGQNQMTVSDQSTTFLWGINSSLKKVTVQTNLVTQQFGLRILALNPTQGTASSEVTLSTTPVDFLTNLGRSSGTSTLKYTGVALASQGTGTDSHSITFTIQTQ